MMAANTKATQFRHYRARRFPGIYLELEPMENHVQDMIAKAAKSEKSDDALKFSQAACNAANAMCALGTAKRDGK